MQQEQLIVHDRDSSQAELGRLVISARETSVSVVELVVGRPGLPNTEKRLRVGEAVLFETPDDGVLEVRVIQTTGNWAKILITQVSPRPGIAGGLVSDDPNNSPFTPDELVQVRGSIQRIKLVMSSRPELPPEQFDFISRKLDEMQEASERLGRKDWMNLAIGTLTSTIVTAALSTDTARTLFHAANSALAWLFNDALKMLR